MGIISIITQTIFFIGLMGAIYFSAMKRLHLYSLFLITYSSLFVIALYMNINGLNNLFIYHIISIIEVIFYIQIFKQYFKTESIKKNLTYTQIISIIISIVLIIYVNPLTEFNVVFQIIEAFALIILASFYFYKTFDDNIDMVKTPLFWYATAIFIYFSTNMILFSSFYLALEVSKTGLDLWIINEISSIIFIALFIFGISKEVRVVKT